MSTLPKFELSVLPADVRQYLVTMLDDACVRSRLSPGATLGSIERSQMLGPQSYILQMYWQGRTDKFSSRALPVFSALTQALVPAEILSKEPAPPYIKPQQSRVMFPEANHRQLATTIMTQVIDAYAVDQGLDPPPPRRSFLRRFL